MYLYKKPINYAAVLAIVTLSSIANQTYAQVVTQSAVEEQVREVFSDIPVMIEIARCESKFRQFTDAGNVLRGGYGGQMIGVFQFFESVHSAEALRQGHDLATLEGNIAYARELYTESGTTPWSSSQPCWQNAQIGQTDTLVSEPSVSVTDAELREKIALLQQLITLLQTLLSLQMET